MLLNIPRGHLRIPMPDIEEKDFWVLRGLRRIEGFAVQYSDLTPSPSPEGKGGGGEGEEMAHRRRRNFLRTGAGCVLTSDHIYWAILEKTMLATTGGETRKKEEKKKKQDEERRKKADEARELAMEEKEEMTNRTEEERGKADEEKEEGMKRDEERKKRTAYANRPKIWGLLPFPSLSPYPSPEPQPIPLSPSASLHPRRGRTHRGQDVTKGGMGKRKTGRRIILSGDPPRGERTGTSNADRITAGATK